MTVHPHSVAMIRHASPVNADCAGTGFLMSPTHVCQAKQAVHIMLTPQTFVPACCSVSSIVLRGATEGMLDDVERAVDDGINAYKVWSDVVMLCWCAELCMLQGTKCCACYSVPPSVVAPVDVMFMLHCLLRHHANTPTIRLVYCLRCDAHRRRCAGTPAVCLLEGRASWRWLGRCVHLYCCTYSSQHARLCSRSAQAQQVRPA